MDFCNSAFSSSISKVGHRRFHVKLLYTDASKRISYMISKGRIRSIQLFWPFEMQVI